MCVAHRSMAIRMNTAHVYSYKEENNLLLVMVKYSGSLVHTLHCSGGGVLQGFDANKGLYSYSMNLGDNVLVNLCLN